VESKTVIQPFGTKIIMADDSNEEETGSHQTGAIDKIEVPIGAVTTKRTVCKETMQSSVTTFTNMELEIKEIDSPERQMQ
jgi:hypothetical protein